MLTFNKIDSDKKYGKIDPNFGSGKGNYEKLQEIQAKWGYISTTALSEYVNGNIAHQIRFNNSNTSNKGFEFVNFEESLDNRRDYSFIEDIISTHLLMYRLICIFFSPPITGNWYKSVWEYPIYHISTGKQLIFGEHKGASNFWLSEMSHTQLENSFKKDLIELLNFLISDQIPHPYDGCTAGQIA